MIPSRRAEKLEARVSKMVRNDETGLSWEKQVLRHIFNWVYYNVFIVSVGIMGGIHETVFIEHIECHYLYNQSRWCPCHGAGLP